MWRLPQLSCKRDQIKVSVKENEVPTEKNSSRESIFATNASYVYQINAKRLRKGNLHVSY